MRYISIPKNCVVSQEALRAVCILHTLLLIVVRDLRSSEHCC